MEPAVTIGYIWSYMLRHFRKFPMGLVVITGNTILEATAISVKPYWLKCILDQVAADTDPATPPGSAVGFYIALYIGLYGVQTIVYRFYDYWVDIQMRPGLFKQIVQETWDALIQKSHVFYQNHMAGSLAYHMQVLENSVPRLIHFVIERFFSNALSMAIALYTLWLVRPVFALMMGMWSLFFVLVSMGFAQKLDQQSQACSAYKTDVQGWILDTLSNILSVRLFANIHYETKQLEHRLDQRVQLEHRFQWTYFYMLLVHGISFLMLQISNFYFLWQGHQTGSISVGDFALVLAISNSIMGFLWGVASDFSEFAKHYGRVVQALRTVITPDTIPLSPHAKPLVVRYGAIVWDHVSFHYPQRETLFDKLSVSIAPGQKVGLVGYSGGGKSTFIHLILRLYEVTGGQILIDGQPIHTVTPASLYRHIAVIPQDPQLFHRTIWENIQYGDLHAPKTAVRQATAYAHAHDFIQALPEGYDTVVGEKGIKLSGGQRQRIAMARAILKNSPIFILDEATSQLDSCHENQIQEDAQIWMAHKTTLVIAHRLSTLIQMDRILVLDQGKIVEDGTHQNLLRQKGIYQKLWNTQSGGFLGDGTGISP